MRFEVFLGTGGVGKTSLAAATALRAAHAGQRTLVLAIDPALRLKTALGMSLHEWQHRVPLESATGGGQLWAALLDVHSTLDQAVRLYAGSAQAKAVLAHPIYRTIISSMAGMQELMAIERLDQAIKDGFETIVIDTAPSRHALEFLDKPAVFSDLASSSVVQLVGRAYKLWERSPFGALGGRSLDLLARVEGLLGATFVRQMLDFHSVFHTIAEGYGRRAAQTATRLRNPAITGFHIVTTPSKAERDAAFFTGELQARRYPVASLTVNRVWPEASGSRPEALPTEAATALAWYDAVSGAHARAWRAAHQAHSGRIPTLRRVPELDRDVDGLPALYELLGHL